MIVRGLTWGLAAKYILLRVSAAWLEAVRSVYPRWKLGIDLHRGPLAGTGSSPIRLAQCPARVPPKACRVAKETRVRLKTGAKMPLA